LLIVDSCLLETTINVAIASMPISELGNHEFVLRKVDLCRYIPQTSLTDMRMLPPL
jgi:hypothetical protein